MQYFKPAAPDQFVGDCMPFFHEGVFHLFWLLDEGHHHAKGGLGAHQWAHSTTTDLVHWEHHPLAIPITQEHECSICTGSVFHHEGTYRAYYATRYPDGSEHLSLAISTDGVHFEKTDPNPFASPGPQYTPSFRDPHVFRDPETGLFHMLVTTSLREPPVHGRGGCLAQLVSQDMESWEEAAPFIVPGYLGDPECPDTFEWNGWHYLVFSNDGVARYRMSRSPLGPWLRPRVDSFDGPMARVMKTAAFTGGRRLGVAFLPTLAEGRDDGAWLYAGNAVFREIVQHPDGTLGTKWPAEMTPQPEVLDRPRFNALTSGVEASGEGVLIQAREGYAAAVAEEVPTDALVQVTIAPEGGASYFGLGLRVAGAYERGYEVRFSAMEQRVEIAEPQARSCGDNAARAITGVEGLNRPFRLAIVMKGDIIDVCIDDRRTLVCRCPQVAGANLVLWAQNAGVEFRDLRVGITR